MQRLTGLDAGFLYMETPSAPMHVAGLAIYDPSDVPDFSLDRITDMVRDRLHLAPPFRRRLVTVPFELHHPVWIEDPDFDLDWHIRSVAVPAPGGHRELAKLAAHLTSLPLDRTRPLWEMWVIEGLEGGNIATLMKVHHAAIDGASGNQLTLALLDLTADPADPPPPDQEWRPDRIPSDAELVGYALSSLSRQPVRAVKALRRTIRAALNIRQISRQSAVTPAAAFRAPPTPINGAITPARSYAMTSLSLSDVKKVKNTFGTTVNDVVLAMCAGALRRYLDARDVQLEAPLVAMVPVSVRSDADATTMGNQVSSAFASLATDIDDPLSRLAAIHDSMAVAKEQQKALPADVLQDWADFAAPAVFSRAARLYSRTGMADRHRPAFNVTISNVPGPPFPLWSAGVPLVANYPLGPISDGLGLNMTVMSYQDQLDFGLLACADLVDDVWAIADGLADALAELVEAADAGTGTAEDRSSGQPAAEPPATPTSTGTSTADADTHQGLPDEAMVRDAADARTDVGTVGDHREDRSVVDGTPVHEGLPNQALVAEEQAAAGPPERPVEPMAASDRPAKATPAAPTIKKQAASTRQPAPSARAQPAGDTGQPPAPTTTAAKVPAKKASNKPAAAKATATSKTARELPAKRAAVRSKKAAVTKASTQSTSARKAPATSKAPASSKATKTAARGAAPTKKRSSRATSARPAR